MKTKHFLLLILLPLLAINCKKEETHKLVTVGGYAVDVATGDTLADVKIRLRTMSKWGASVRLDRFDVLIDSSITDEKVFFSFTFLMEKDKNYCFEPIIENYFWHPSMTVTTVHIESGVENMVTLVPLIFLKMNIKNEYSSTSNDSIYYWGPIDRSSSYVDNWWHPQSYRHEFYKTGIEVDTTFFVTLQYQEVPLQYWDVTKNGTTTRHAAYVGCTPKDTCFFEIKY
jgi:hypothetical protein